jgi:hypothetical protein
LTAAIRTAAVDLDESHGDPTMGASLLAVTVALLAFQPPPADHAALVELLDSLQPATEDFRCEYEGTYAFTSEEVKRGLKLNADGVADSFSGVFIRSRNGDTRVDILHKAEPGGRVSQEQLLVRAVKGESEQYVRQDNRPHGRGSIQNPLVVNANRQASYGLIYLIDVLKRLLASPALKARVEDERVGDRDLKRIDFLVANTSRLQERYWIDPARGGHVVRHERFLVESGALLSRIAVELKAYPGPGGDVWMPVSGRGEGFVKYEGGRFIPTEEPQTLQILYVVAGTMQFNRRPGPKTFTIAYRPGTPISDNLRKLQYEFGQQEVPPNISKAEAEAQLKAQLAQAEAQRTELSASSPAAGPSAWARWLPWVLGSSTVVLLLVLLIQRRAH